MEDSFDDLQASLTEVDGEELRRSLRFRDELDRVEGWEILSAIHQLPPEILSEIFIECLPPYSAAPASTRAPLLLGAICRDWRETALSTPGIWSSFILSVDLVRATDDCSLIRLFETWLSRGGNWPLTMVVNCISALPREHTLPDSFISALSRSSSRWHDVNLILPLADFYRLQSNEGLPLLRRLAIKVALHNPSVESTLPSLNLFSNAPMLNDVSLGDGFTLSNVVLPLHQLTYFDSRASATAAQYVAVLSNAPKLVEIRLDLHTAERWTISVPVRANIKSLNIQSSIMWESSVLDLLHCITCPELETLVISGLAPMLSKPLFQLLSRSSPPLRELFLDFASYLPNALIDTVACLIAVPTLVRLEIKPLAGETAHDIFNRMYDPMSQFLPRLQTLRVQVNIGQVPPLSWTYDTLTRMLVARWNRQAGRDVDQLQVFALSFSTSGSVRIGTEAVPFAQPDPTTFSQLEILAEAGMDIELITDREVFANSTSVS
ncbi:hypothetical protein B0H19DRAFT_1200251 [Mycena capillaripes]|nr:hypothetical protein B0H19DRAFT_1200251 [Mycena capillaripes]